MLPCRPQVCRAACERDDVEVVGAFVGGRWVGWPAIT